VENVIEIKNLTKSYGWFLWKRKVPALDRLTLSVPKGGVFGFLGPNGAGKTTTIRLLMDLIHPSSGEAFVLGRPPSDVAVKGRVGFLPDSPSFNSYLTAREFLDLCAKLLAVPSGERRSRINEVLEIVGMSKHADSKLGAFSRGMTQRVGIAQAILNRPELLILDEPLVGLDPHGRQELKEIIASQKSEGTNVFFCSHILSDVERMCDHIGILCDGKLLCCGSTDELLSHTGIRVHVKPDCSDLAAKLLPDASGSMRLPDGGWEIVFPSDKTIAGKIDKALKSYPNCAVKTPSRESLEDFFFRQIESARGDEEVSAPS